MLPKRDVMSGEGEEIHVNLDKIKEWGIVGHAKIVESDGYGIELLPYSRMFFELSKAKIPQASAMQEMWENRSQLLFLQTNGQVEFDQHASQRTLEFRAKSRQGSINRIVSDLKEIGVEISEEELAGEMVSKETQEILGKYLQDPNKLTDGLWDVIVGVQNELKNIVQATRIFEEAKLILRKAYPNHKLPEWPSLYTLDLGGESLSVNMKGRVADNKSSREDMKNAGHAAVSDGHLFQILESRLGKNEYRELTSKKIITLGSDIGKFVAAGHEMGHACFDELFNFELVQKICSPEMKKNNQLRMIDTLSEGYAVLSEQLALEAVQTTEMNRYTGDDVEGAVDKLRARRVGGLMKHRRDKNDRYVDGFLITRKIERALDNLHLPIEERVKLLGEFLSQIDIEKMANVVAGTPEYDAILKQPMQGLVGS